MFSPMPKVINTILSGGFGTRLWPLSRPSFPKQFLKLFEGRSLFQHTVLRNTSMVDATMILTNENHYVMAREQMAELGFEFDHTVLEPVARNTAPAITLAALSVAPEDILFVTPSDHMISDKESYQASVARALELAAEGYLVTFSIAPTHAETGYGYIETQGEQVLSFREKPDARTALRFLEQGNFYWNSGMFCFRAGVFLEEISKHSPELYQAAVAAYEQGITAELMSAIPEDSVDYAVFEKSDRIRTVQSSFPWTDLGTFDSLMNYLTSFAELPEGVQAIEGVSVKDSYALSKKRVLGIGIDGLLVIDTPETILVLPKEKSQEVKTLYSLFQ